MRVVLSLLALFLMASIADAQIRRRVIQHCNQVAVVQQVEQVAVVQQIVPVLVAQPVFVDPRISYLHVGGSYYPPPQVQLGLSAPIAPVMPQALEAAPCPRIDENALFEKFLQRMDARSQQKPAPPPVPGFKQVSFPAPQPERTFINVMQQNCIECHSATPKGNTLSMFAFARAHMLPGVNYDNAWKAIIEGRMPPATRPRVSNPDVQILRRAFGLERS